MLFSRAWCYSYFRTISSSLHLLQCWLAEGFVGQLQLVSKPALITLCFGLDNTQLRVDVLVLICCIFLVLKSKCGISVKENSRYLCLLLTEQAYSLGSMEFILQGVDFLFKVLDL